MKEPLFEKSYTCKMKKKRSTMELLGYEFRVEKSKLKSILESMLRMHIENHPLIFSISGSTEVYKIEIDNSSYTKSIFVIVSQKEDMSSKGCYLGGITDKSIDGATRYFFELGNLQTVLSEHLDVTENGRYFICDVHDCLREIFDSYSNREC